MKHLVFALPVLALTLMGQECTGAGTACRTMTIVKNSFDQFAAEGEFSPEEVRQANAVFMTAKPLCDNPGNYNAEDVVAIATNAVIVLRRVMRGSDVAYPVLAPQLDKLEQLLKEARK